MGFDAIQRKIAAPAKNSVRIWALAFLLSFCLVACDKDPATIAQGVIDDLNSATANMRAGDIQGSAVALAAATRGRESMPNNVQKCISEVLSWHYWAVYDNLEPFIEWKSDPTDRNAEIVIMHLSDNFALLSGGADDYLTEYSRRCDGLFPGLTATRIAFAQLLVELRPKWLAEIRVQVGEARFKNITEHQQQEAAQLNYQAKDRYTAWQDLTEAERRNIAHDDPAVQSCIDETLESCRLSGGVSKMEVADLCKLGLKDGFIRRLP